MEVAGGSIIVPGDDVMLGYVAAGGSSVMGPGGGDLLGPSGDYSPQGTPTPMGHGGPTQIDNQTPGSAGGYGTGGPTTYSPQDSPASSAGGGANGTNGQLPSFGFTQEQVACVCEVRWKLRFYRIIKIFRNKLKI